MVADKTKKQKSGAVLAIVLVLVYIIGVVGTLKYTGVIGGSGNKKTNAASKNVDMKDKTGKSKTGTSAAAKKTGATSTTLKKNVPSTTIANGTKGTSGSSITAQANDQDGQQQLKRLVKIYESMDSDQAAKIIEELSDDEAVSLLTEINEEQAAEILAAMDASRAATLSKKLGLQSQ